MSEALNIIKAHFGSLREVTTAPVWQYDYGKKLEIDGIPNLPSTFEIHYSNSKARGTAKRWIGYNGVVDVLDEYLRSGADVWGFIFLHEGEDDGQTEYVIHIPVKERSEAEDSAPTPVQRDIVDEAIAALNDAVEQTGEDKAATAALAQAAAASSLVATEAAQSAQGSATAASASATTASTAAATATAKASDAATSAANAASAKTAAETAEANAQAAQTASENAQASAESSAQTATAKASEAAASAASVGEAAQTATAKAAEATQAAENAEAAQQAIENMTVSSQTLSAGSQATVTKTESEGIVNLAFGIPQGDPAPVDMVDESVRDWLDDHPEATTTVEDGAVTWAKLNSAVQIEISDKAPAIREAGEKAYTHDATGQTEIKVYGNTFESETVKLYDKAQFAFSNDNYISRSFSGLSFTPNGRCYKANGTATGYNEYVWLMTNGTAADIPEALKGKTVRMRVLTDKAVTMPYREGTTTSTIFDLYVDGTRVLRVPTGAIDNSVLDVSGTVSIPASASKWRVLWTHLTVGSVFDNVNFLFLFYDNDVNVYDTQTTVNNSDTTLVHIPSGYSVVDTGAHQNAIYGVIDTKEYVDEHIPSNVITQEQLQIYTPTVENLSYVTPEMFGAVGDGVTDDSDAFQAALNEVSSSLPFRAYKIYKITRQMEIAGDNLDIYINNIDFRGSDASIIKLSGSYNKFYANRLYAYFANGSAAFRLETTEEYHARYNNICVQCALGNGNCIELVNRHGVSDTRHMYYNKFYFGMLYALNGHVIYVSADRHANENSFWCKHVTNNNGYVYYVDPNYVAPNNSSNRLYEFCIEAASKNGVYGIASLIRCRTAECMGRRTLSDPTQGNIYVVEGFCKPQKIRTTETDVAYNALVVENAATFDDWVEKCGAMIDEGYSSTAAFDNCFGIESSDFSISDCFHLWLAYDDPVHQGSGSYGKAGKLIAYYNHKGFVPLYPEQETIIDAQYRTIYTTGNVPTIFNIGVTGEIYLDDSYCAVGINKIEVIQRDGYTTKIISKDGETVIFDGTNLGNGTFVLSCIRDPLTEIIIHTQTQGDWVKTGHQIQGIYTGSNEHWEIERRNIIS